MTAVHVSTKFQAQDVVRFPDGSLGVVIGNFSYPIDGAEFVEVAREYGINFFRAESLTLIGNLGGLVYRDKLG